MVEKVTKVVKVSLKLFQHSQKNKHYYLKISKCNYKSILTLYAKKLTAVVYDNDLVDVFNLKQYICI